MKLTKQRLMEIAGLKTEAQVHELDAAVKDKVAYKKFIDAMDILLDDWYAAGFTKDDVVEYMSGTLPEGPGISEGGYYGERDSYASDHGIEDIANELVDKLKADTSLSNAGISLEGLNSQQERALNDALLNALMDIGEEYNIVF